MVKGISHGISQPRQMFWTISRGSFDISPQVLYFPLIQNGRWRCWLPGVHWATTGPFSFAEKIVFPQWGAAENGQGSSSVNMTSYDRLIFIYQLLKMENYWKWKCQLDTLILLSLIFEYKSHFFHFRQYQQRIPNELLCALATSLVDSTVFKIVSALIDIQHGTEKQLFAQRTSLIQNHESKD